MTITKSGTSSVLCSSEGAGTRITIRHDTHYDLDDYVWVETEADLSGTWWFLRRGDHKAGPFTFDELVTEMDEAAEGEEL